MNAGLLLNAQVWKLWMQYGTYTMIGLGILVFLFYHFRVILISGYKDKYDFINKYEITYYITASFCLILAGWFFLNSVFSAREHLDIGIFLARMLGTLVFISIFMVVIYNVLKIYYPAVVEKKLNKWRYKPRKSPKTGKEMKLLSEEEEDVYLTEGMQAEENVFSIDYDVWMDEETGYTQIEKYQGNLHAEYCSECGFHTMKVVKEEVVDSPSTGGKGELLKHFECTYCGHREKKTFTIGKIQEAEGNPAST
jgi:hypothetical protein